MNNVFSIVLSYVVEHLLPYIDFTFETKNNNCLQQCIEIDRFFFEHYTEPITVSDLAKALNYSETHTLVYMHSFKIFYNYDITKARFCNIGYFKRWYFKCSTEDKTIAFIPAYH